MGMKDSIDVVYVVASKLGTIGMGTAAYNAIKQLEHSELSYKIFCRGYNRKLELIIKTLFQLDILNTYLYLFDLWKKNYILKLILLVI